MGSAGSAHSRFLRALERRSLLLVKAAAMECGQLALDDALKYTLYLARSDEARNEEFERVAVRWHSRWVARTAVGASEASLALSSLLALRGPAAVAAQGTLLDLTEAHGQLELARVLGAELER